jgi:NAD(P)-dependent dehydrogenase (short-subunit alcohol dehydrogenase family)
MNNVLITGASSGIGQQLAKDYAKAGSRVYACARSKNSLNSLAEESAGTIIPIVVDVSAKDEIAESFNKVSSLDVIILNAGTCEYVDIDNFDSALFERVFQVNFFGVIYCVEILLPKLKKGGKIVIVGSMARLLPFTRAEAYGSSKAAIDYFTKSLSVDLSDRDISVISVDPGFVKTPLTDKNDFSMPFLVNVEYASTIIIKKISKGCLYITFPRRLSWVLSFCNRLPSHMQRKICIWMKESQ